MSMQSENPATTEALDDYPELDEEALDGRLDAAADAFDGWSDRSITEREALLSEAAEVLRDNQERYAELITREMGKPIGQARSEVEKCAWVCDYYAERAGEHLQDEVIGSEVDAETFVSYEPLGAVLAVMPWNFPFWQVFRFAAPNLTAGNVCLLKHASNVPGCAEAIEEVFREAGYPEGAFSSLFVGSESIDDVISDDRVAAVTITGSTGAGRAVAETAGSELKKTVLELGGSDPFVVLDDAPMERACEVAADARTINSGQSCIAAKRFIVVDEAYDEFVEGFVGAMESKTVGDPMDEGTEVGPQARGDLLETLHEQVQDTVDEGATLETGGEPLDREGYFYPPTVLTEVSPDSTAATDEVFGPAAAVLRAEDEEEAVQLANDSHLGLGGSVWTENLDRGRRLAREVESGMVCVNEMTKSDPRLPFGGVKNSGYGRELGRMGIREFVNRKTVRVQHAPSEGGSPVE